MEQSHEHPAQQLLAIAEQLEALARLMLKQEHTDSVDSTVELRERSVSVEENATENTTAAETDVQSETTSEEVVSSAKDKKEGTVSDPVGKAPAGGHQIGGGINGVLGGFRPNDGGLPGLGNLFGGLNGLGNLGVSAPASPEEVRKNPAMMSMLESLEQNPVLLNTLSSMSGMDREQILQAVRMIRGGSGQTAATAAESTAAPVNGTAPAELLRGLSGGGPSLSGSALTPLRGNMGGDPLTNLLQQWHWTPLRS